MSIPSSSKRADLLSLARFPLLAVIVCAAVMVIRVPLISGKQFAQADVPDDAATRYTTITSDESLADSQADLAAPPAESPPTDRAAKSPEQIVQKDHPATARPKTGSPKTGPLKTGPLKTSQRANSASTKDRAHAPKAANTVKSRNTATPSPVESREKRATNNRSGVRTSQQFPRTQTESVSTQIRDTRPVANPATPDVLRLRNPITTRITVHFVVDREMYQLHPGQYVEFFDQDVWTVRFHRGGKYGNSRNRVPPGNYAFSVTDQGWRLRRAGDPPADEVRVN